MITYIILSILVSRLIISQSTNNKDKTIQNMNRYMGIKVFINFFMACILVFLLVMKIQKKNLLLFVMPAFLSLCFGIVDSVALYSTVKKIRRLDCSKKEYFKQIVSDNVLLHLSWFAASLFGFFSRNKSSDSVFFAKYFLFWIAINYITIILRRKVMKCKECEDENLISLLNDYQIDGYKLYIYDGKSRKTANAMVDSFFGYGNIFFSDYLLENLDSREIEAVFMHEVGHIKKHHITIRNILLMMIAPLLYITGSIMDEIEKYWHINICLGIIFLIVVLVLYIVFAFFYISRRQEYEADMYAAKKISNSEYLCSALKKLYRLNDILESKRDNEIIKTHPIIDKRIERIRNCRN